VDLDKKNFIYVEKIYSKYSALSKVYLEVKKCFLGFSIIRIDCDV